MKIKLFLNKKIEEINKMQEKVSPEQSQQMKNHSFKTELKDGKIDSKRYKLHFDKETAEKIRLFCLVFYLNASFFITKSLIPELRSIQEDMEQDLEIFANYFDLENLAEDRCEIDVSKGVEKDYELEVEIHPLIVKPIEQYSKSIRWTPENFIVSIIECKINDIFKSFKNCDYQFIGMYFDLKKINKFIDEISPNKVIE